MIPRTHPLRQTPAWQTELARAITDPAELLKALELDLGLLPAARRAAREFALRVPRGFVTRMRKRDPHDPLLLQVMPLAAECVEAPGFDADPVGDRAAMAVPGLLHKYRGRVLLTATGACAIHCRYCFRRHFPYGEANPATGQWRQALAYIGADDSIGEVILSGGDPLTLSDRRLSEFVAQLGSIPHVRRLRVHTRLPIVLPERVTAELLDWLSTTHLKTVVVVHANHANEIDAGVRAALSRLRESGVTLLNQTVLLRGVNDRARSLEDLSLALFDAGALPYYLHALDRVRGAAHFEVEEAAARAILAELNARLPGYLVPRLVRELPGAPGKMPLCL